MEPWERICHLHEDRPSVYHRMQHACATMLKNRHFGDVNSREHLEALLTILEYCGDFHCQSLVLTMILCNDVVQQYKDWIAPTWFKNRPNTLTAFLDLMVDKSDQGLSHCDFLNVYNNELEMQFLYSTRCCLARWNGKFLQHYANRGVLWLHLNCGTKTMSLTGLQAVPTEFSTQKKFLLRSSEILKVTVFNLVPAHNAFGKLQGIEISSSKGQLFVHTDPHIADWTMFVHFVNFISKVTVEFVNHEKEGSNLTDCNGNEPSVPSQNYFGHSENASPVQHVAQNSVFQVSCSQDDAFNALANNQRGAALQMFSDSENNEVEICHHYKRDSINESCNDSDTADENHDKISVPVDNKNACEEKKNAEDISCHQESQPLDLPNVDTPSTEEDNNPLQQVPSSKLKMSQHCDLDDENKPITEEDKTSQAIVSLDKDVTDVPDPKYKQKKLRRKGPRLPARPRPLTSPRTLKQKGESQEESEKSDDDSILATTPRRMTRQFTQLVNGINSTNDGEGSFKTPTVLPKVVRNQGRKNRKRKSDGTNHVTEVETSLTSGTVPSQPLAEDTSEETSPSRSIKPSSGDDSGTYSAVDETMESTIPPKVCHSQPESMPTLNTPIATPVREPEDSLIQTNFGNVHEKLNEELKLDTFKEDIPYALPGPPPAIPLRAHPSQRASVFRDYNMCLPPKHRKFDVDDDADLKSETGDAWDASAMDSSSDTSYLDNAGSVVLLPPLDGGFPSDLKASPPVRDMNNLQQFSEICSNVESTDTQ